MAPPSAPARKWLPLKDAAAYVSMHPDTLREKACIPGTLIRRKKETDRGSKHLYEVKSLDAWIESWEDA